MVECKDCGWLVYDEEDKKYICERHNCVLSVYRYDGTPIRISWCGIDDYVKKTWE